MLESLTTELDITVLARPKGQVDWRLIFDGPGTVALPENEEIGVRLRMGNGDTLEALVKEIRGLSALTMLNLSENRNIYDDGLDCLPDLPQLRILNLSSVSLTNAGMEFLRPLLHLTHLDLSFCNRINDLGVKLLRQLPNLAYLNLQGCSKVTNAGVARIRRRGLEIKK
jgi:hypothetical protein